MDFIKKSPEDVAEDIVYGWYSNTRHKSIESKGVISSLRLRITGRLLKQGVNDKLAHDLAFSAINQWVMECSGLETSNPVVMECLVAHVSNVIK